MYNPTEEWNKYFQTHNSSHKFKNLEKIKQTVEGEKTGNLIKRMLEYSEIKSLGKVLEVGFGSGKRSLAFAMLGFDVTAIDCSDYIIANFNQTLKLGSEYLANAKLKIVKTDAMNLNLNNNCFDLVFNEGVVEHWLEKKDRLKVIGEMYRVTKYNGTVGITVPNGKHFLDWWWDLTKYPGFVQELPMFHYGYKELKKEMRDVGLKDVRIFGFQKNPWSFVNHWPRNIFFRYVTGGLKRLIPVTEKWNAILNIHLIGIGRKE
ncbi:class I SAM-dependent methyltransferase [bacterium]|nr:class I SAM-dependent methyltransferase [bacterium]